MQIPERTRFVGDETEMDFWWEVNGSLVDFHTGYTYVLTVAPFSDWTDVQFSKTTGFAGAVGSGHSQDDDGVPNLVVTCNTSGEFNSLDAGRYLLQIVATKTGDSSEETLQMKLTMRARVG